MIVTIIGSRMTPLHILAIMQVLSKYFYKSGWILRSGGADGADTAGATHYPVNDPLREIYVPWKNFNNVEDGIHDGDVDDGSEGGKTFVFCEGGGGIGDDIGPSISGSYPFSNGISSISNTTSSSFFFLLAAI